MLCLVLCGQRFNKKRLVEKAGLSANCKLVWEYLRKNSIWFDSEAGL